MRPLRLSSQPGRHRGVVPSDLAALAPSGRMMAAVPADLAALAEAVRGQPCLRHQAVLTADKTVVSLGTYVRRLTKRGRLCGRRRDQDCRSNSDNRAR